MKRNEIKLLGYFSRLVHQGGKINLYDFIDLELGHFLIGVNKTMKCFDCSGKENIYRLHAEVSSTVYSYPDNDNFIKITLTLKNYEPANKLNEVGTL